MKKDFKKIYSLYFNGYIAVSKSTFVDSNMIKIVLFRPKRTARADWKSFYLK